jgi:hypothetical protein
MSAQINWDLPSKRVNSTLQKLRAAIRSGGYTGRAFKDLIAGYIDINGGCLEEPGYDNLDILINRLFHAKAMPEQTIELEPEMVYFQKTPARVVFELVERCPFSREDVFFDLGSGLGQVAMLVNLLTGVSVKGIEFEPAFCDYAGNCAAELRLPNVTFINADARKADYSEGTVFFMYTPFRGEILREVLALLRKESLHRKITLISYGPCTAEVALQNWLDPATPMDNNMYKIGIFSSL